MSEVTDIGHMFNGLKSITSLDLSNFITPKINVPVELLFHDCPKLEYINLKNAYFITANKNDFINAAKNVVFCNNDERILSKVIGYECAVINCSENWRESQKKIYNDECIVDCSSNDDLKYNYNSICIESCPNRTYNNNYICEDCHPDCKKCEKGPEENTTNCKSCLSSDKYLQFGNCVSNCSNGYYEDENDKSLKICKCDLEKCYKCSEESFIQNLCLTCNDGYYQKYDAINIYIIVVHLKIVINHLKDII